MCVAPFNELLTKAMERLHRNGSAKAVLDSRKQLRPLRTKCHMARCYRLMNWLNNPAYSINMLQMDAEVAREFTTTKIPLAWTWTMSVRIIYQLVQIVDDLRMINRYGTPCWRMKKQFRA